MFALATKTFASAQRFQPQRRVPPRCRPACPRRRRCLSAAAMTVQPSESVLIVDFGSQVTQLIARRVREAGVYSEIAPFGTSADAFARLAPGGVILSGSPASVLDPQGPRIPQAILESGRP